MKNDIIRRIFWGVVLGTTAVFMLLLGGYALLVGVILVAGQALREFYSLLSREGTKTAKVIGYPFALLILLMSFFSEQQEVQENYLGFLVAVFILLSFLIQVIQNASGRRPYRVPELAVTLFGSFYIAGLLSYIFLYKKFYTGVSEQMKVDYLILVPVVGAWGYDTSAFFSGKLFGETRMTPVLSPKKTWEGVAGGLAGVTAAFALLWWFGLKHLGLPLWNCLLMGGILGIAAQLGDLSVSALKREVQAKDSSRLIPGHGGLLDRMDSFLFTLPVGFYLLRYWVLPSAGGAG